MYNQKSQEDKIKENKDKVARKKWRKRARKKNDYNVFENCKHYVYISNIYLYIIIYNNYNYKSMVKYFSILAKISDRFQTIFGYCQRKQIKRH